MAAGASFITLQYGILFCGQRVSSWNTLATLCWWWWRIPKQQV